MTRKIVKRSTFKKKVQHPEILYPARRVLFSVQVYKVLKSVVIMEILVHCFLKCGPEFKPARDENNSPSMFLILSRESDYIQVGRIGQPSRRSRENLACLWKQKKWQLEKFRVFSFFKFDLLQKPDPPVSDSIRAEEWKKWSWRYGFRNFDGDPNRAPGCSISWLYLHGSGTI
jgi:hypothetical protein